MYQTQGCRCLRCRAAEATYRQQLRTRKAKHLPVLGAYISASEAWARIRTLKAERFSERQISGWCKAHHHMKFSPQSRVRLRTLLRLRALCQQYLIDDSELPNHTRGAYERAPTMKSLKARNK